MNDQPKTPEPEPIVVTLEDVRALLVKWHSNERLISDAFFCAMQIDDEATPNNERPYYHRWLVELEVLMRLRGMIS